MDDKNVRAASFVGASGPQRFWFAPGLDTREKSFYEWECFCVFVSLASESPDRL